MRAIFRVRAAVVAAGISLAAIAPAMANSIFMKAQGVIGPVTNAAFVGAMGGLAGKTESFTWDCAN
jgi:hypothetical protein